MEGTKKCPIYPCTPLLKISWIRPCCSVCPHLESQCVTDKLFTTTGTRTQEQGEIKIRYEAEIERLNRKLKWYAENQEILDRDLVKIKVKDQEIKELKNTVERLKKQQGKEIIERKERTNERTSDAKRIRDLERQVWLR
jgi:protein QN1